MLPRDSASSARLAKRHFRETPWPVFSTGFLNAAVEFEDGPALLTRCRSGRQLCVPGVGGDGGGAGPIAVTRRSQQGCERGSRGGHFARARNVALGLRHLSLSVMAAAVLALLRIPRFSTRDQLVSPDQPLSSGSGRSYMTSTVSIELPIVELKTKEQPNWSVRALPVAIRITLPPNCYRRSPDYPPCISADRGADRPTTASLCEVLSFSCGRSRQYRRHRQPFFILRPVAGHQRSMRCPPPRRGGRDRRPPHRKQGSSTGCVKFWQRTHVSPPHVDLALLEAPANHPDLSSLTGSAEKASSGSLAWRFMTDSVTQAFQSLHHGWNVSSFIAFNGKNRDRALRFYRARKRRWRLMGGAKKKKKKKIFCGRAVAR